MNLAIHQIPVLIYKQIYPGIVGDIKFQYASAKAATTKNQCSRHLKNYIQDVYWKTPEKVNKRPK